MGILKSHEGGILGRTALEGRRDWTLPDIAPMDRIRALLEAHYRLIQIPIGLVAPDNTLLLNIGWQALCRDFHRAHPDSERCCIESNHLIQSKLRAGEVAAEKCGNGLWDIAMPILVEEQHLATLFIGQFLYDDEIVDRDFFIAQARCYGYAEEAYLQALAQVPRLSRERARDIIGYTVNLVSLLAESSYKNKLLLQEIHERRLADYALREGERQYRALVENVPGAVYLCLNDDAYTTIFMSDAIETLGGWSARHMVDEAASIADLIHPEDLDAVHQQVDEALIQRQPYVLRYRLRHRQGHYIHVEERGQGVWDETNVLRFLQGVIFDVTERHQMEQERHRLETHMARTHKLESLAILAGGVAHDFNNLLVGILGHADLALEDLEPASPVRDSIQAIIQASQRAADLTRQMLAYSGRGHFMVEPIELTSLVKSQLPVLRETLQNRFILRHEPVHDTPRINADAAQFRQLLKNLVINAAESYGGNTGDILLRTGTISCDINFINSVYHNDEYLEGPHVYIEVCDNGCGMDEETKHRLCDPFFSTKFPGRGLGMAAVLGIVRGHKGLIAVDSAPNKGTRIQVLFPVAGRHPVAHNHAPERSVNIKGRILLVDDEEIIRNVAKKMLGRAGLRPLIAENGHEALRLVRERVQDIVCVILDLTMPEMNGEKTFHAIREINPDVPIILSSGYSRDEALSRLSGHQPAAFLQKPYKMNVLVETLQQVLSDTFNMDLE